jgi:hypothetical protein
MFTLSLMALTFGLSASAQFSKILQQSVMDCPTATDTHYDALVPSTFFAKVQEPELQKLLPSTKPLSNRITGSEAPVDLIAKRVERFLNPERAEIENLATIQSVMNALPHFSQASAESQSALKTRLLQNLNSLGLITTKSIKVNGANGQPSLKKDVRALDADLYLSLVNNLAAEIELSGLDHRSLKRYDFMVKQLELEVSLPYEFRVTQVRNLKVLAQDIAGGYLLKPGEAMSDLRTLSNQFESGALRTFTATNRSIVKMLEPLHQQWLKADASGQPRKIRQLSVLLNNVIPRAAALFQSNSKEFWDVIKPYEVAMREASRGNYPREQDSFHYANNDQLIDYGNYQKLQEIFGFYYTLLPENFYAQTNEYLPRAVASRFRVKKILD